MGPHPKDISGQRYGTLTAVRIAGGRGDDWEMLCDCGNVIIRKGAVLRYALKTSDGGRATCRLPPKDPRGHGKATSKLYRVWHNMKTRCYNKREKSYINYGGRGITVCDEWVNDYLKFHRWAHDNGYREELTIDRKNNDGNYEPSNCRWSTHMEQQQNTRQTRIITARGESLSVSAWARRCGIHETTLRERISDGWNIDDAVSLPPQSTSGYFRR